jgi:hypothetical protein
MHPSMALNPPTNGEWETSVREASPENARKMRQFALDHIDAYPERWTWLLYIAAKVTTERGIKF